MRVRLPVVATLVSLLIAAGPAVAGDRNASQSSNNADAAKAVGQAQARLTRAREEHLVAAQSLRAALVASERELHGAGHSPPGAGPRYIMARREADAARADLIRSDNEILALRLRLEQARGEGEREPAP